MKKFSAGALRVSLYYASDNRIKSQAQKRDSILQQKKRALRSYLTLFVIWLVMVLLFVAISARQSINQARDEVKLTGTALHRVLSQRAAQHDAHLTSLNALILAANPPPVDALRQVSRNIIRFYPRITVIDVLLLNREGADITMKPVLMVEETEHASVAADFAPQIIDQKPGEVRSYISATTPDRYYLGKKSDNSNPGYAIIMAINPALMIEPDERPVWADLTLKIDGQTVLKQQSDTHEQASALLEQPVFSQFIDSQNQPVLLTLSRPMALTEVVDPLRTVLFAVLSLIALVSGYWLWRSVQMARQAEQKASLLEHETRLAHAARVNAMGELASGIAHELTQPLTALLSQSQAALRLETSGEHPALLRQALTANVREASRAGEILQRMRSYMSNHEPQRKRTEINQIIRDVSELLHTDLAQRHITLHQQTEKTSPVIIADAVEMEQVLYNLIRNAADSLAQSSRAEKQVILNAISRNGLVIVTVTDNGDGIADDILPRLFEPFFTTRNGGMGLGLSLCATLIERIGGEISAANLAGGGAVFTMVIPEAAPLQKAD